MNRGATRIVQAAVLFGVIVLPQAERAAHLEMGIIRGRVVENAYLLADAAERYAETSGGTYPSAVHSFSGYLPAQQNLMNPVTLLPTEPVDGQAAAAGQLGYIPFVNQGYDVGYSITVFGADATQGPNRDGIMLVIQKVTDPPPPPAQR